MPDLETIFVSTITALLSGVTVAYFTNKFSASRSTEEKIWELRRASYGLILTELAAVESVLDELDSRILRDAASITLDVSNAYNRRTGTHLESARKAYTDSYLILSNRFIDLFEEFLLSFDNVDDLSPSEGHKIISAAIRAGRPKLLQQARSEMPRRTRWPALL
jgi:hypothetical protein